jgi:condensation domain-containing protein
VETIAGRHHLSDTKRRLIALLLKKEKARRAGSEPVLRSHTPACAPLSFAQEEIWHGPGGIDKPPFYNESITIHRHGPLDVGALQQSLTEIVRRHEIWRTTFENANGRLTQLVHPAPKGFPIDSYDLSGLPESEKEKEALRLGSEQARERLDLRTGPLVRARLVHLGDAHHRLYVTMHQIIVDGISVFRVLPVELIKLYEAFADGRPSPLPEPVIQYRDFATWQREILGEEALERQLNYWQERLSGELPALRWPPDRLSSVQTYRGSIVPGEWPSAVAEELHAVCRAQSVSLFMGFLAGFVALWHGHTKQEDIVVGTFAPAGREREDVQGLLGCFMNPVPLRFRVTPNMRFYDLLHQARQVVSGAVANDDVPFYRVAEQASGNSDPADNPLFDAVISLAPGLPDLGPGWGQTFMDVESGGSRWNLYLELNERPHAVIFRTQYNPDLFDVETIRRITNDLKSVLEAAAAKPATPISELLGK